MSHQKKKQSTPQDLKEFRSKTISRIIDNKREENFRRVNELEEQKKESNAFRIRYKEEIKKKIAQTVVDKVDKSIIKSIENRKGIVTTEFFQQKQEYDKQLQMYLSNLDDDDNYNAGENDILAQNGILLDESTAISKKSAKANNSCAASSSSLKTGGILSKITQATKNPAKLTLAAMQRSSQKVTDHNQQVTEALQDLMRVDPPKTDSFKSRKPRGLMLKLMQEAGIPLSMASTDGSFGSNNTPLKQSTNSPLNATTYPTENAFATFVDCCYLVGPDKESIASLTKNFAASHSDMISVISDRSPDKINKVNDKVFKLEPKILFRSDNEFPAEMMMLLPSYCFPCDSEVTLDTKPSAMRRNSHLTKTNFQALENKKNRKKIRIFFPSDNSIKLEDGKTLSGDAAENNLINTSIISTYQKTTFVLLLGDHTYQRYCFSVNFPVVFWNSQENILVQTTYTMCFLTQFPFISYLSHVINQFDEEMQLFTFHNALSIFDPSAPVGSDLRNLHDVANKLRKISVPFYPALSKPPQNNNNNNSNNNQAASTITNAMNLAASMKDTDNNKQGDQQEMGIVGNRPEILSHIPEVTIDVASKASQRHPVIFKRKYYSTFYSDLLKSSTVNDDGGGGGGNNTNEEVMWSKVLEKMKSNFSPSSLHRNEKEKEDSFFMLQWSLPVLLKFLPLDQIILAIGCSITEMKIIVKHKDLHIVSSIVFALIYLLRPLKWCSPVIVSLPESLNDFIDSPVPIILGLQELPKGYLLPERCVVVDPAERIVHLNPIDIVQSQTIILPNASRLVSALKSPFDTITKLSKKKNQKCKPTNISPIQHANGGSCIDPLVSPIQPIGRKELIIDVPSPSSIVTANLNLHDKFVGGLESTATVSIHHSTNDNNNDQKSARRPRFSNENLPPPPPPMSIFNSPPAPGPSLPSFPLEMDVENSNCFMFMSAIQQFSSAVYSHIQVVLNTALQMQHKEKEDARAKRRKLLNVTLKGSKKTPTAVANATNNNWQPVQISNIPRGVETRNNTNFDDTVSDVTFADLPSESGNSDDMEKESVSQGNSSGASVSSTASSLPSLQSNAPKLLNKDIGQHGLKFFTKLRETQMYSNYCQYLKVLRNSSSSAVGNTDFSTDSSTIKGLDINLALLDDMGDGESNDSIALLFEVILSGSIGVDTKTFHEHFNVYQNLYSSEIKGHEFDQAKINEIVSKLPAKQRKWNEHISKDSTKMQKYIEEVTMKYVTEKQPKMPLQIDKLRYCNGLLCNGFCNTEICSEICVNMWACQVQSLRHEHMKYELLAKKFDFSNKTQSIGTTAETATTEIEKPQIKYITKHGAKYEAVKHAKETESQFLMRAGLMNQTQLLSSNSKSDKKEGPNLNESLSKPLKATLSKNPSSSKVRPITAISLHTEKPPTSSTPGTSPSHHLKSKSPSVQTMPPTASEQHATASTKFLKTRCFTKSTDPYIRHLAKYYAKREAKSVKRYMKRCFERIERFLFRYIFYYRKMKLLHYVRFLQALVRGNFVRKQQHLINLKARKLLRWGAIIKIRNYIRNRMNEITECLSTRRKREKKKRLSLISIPVAEADIIIAERERAKLLSGVSSRKSVTTNPAGHDLQSLRYIAEPELTPSASSINNINNNNHNQHNQFHPPPNSLKVSSPEQSSSNRPPLSKSHSVPFDPNQPHFATDPNHPNLSNTHNNNNSQYPPKSTSKSYSRQVKEFLQFGKALTRNSSAVSKNSKPMYIPKPLPKKPSSTTENIRGIAASPLGDHHISSSNSISSEYLSLHDFTITSSGKHQFRGDDERSVLSYMESVNGGAGGSHYKTASHSSGSGKGGISSMSIGMEMYPVNSPLDDTVTDTNNTMKRIPSIDTMLSPEDLPNDFPGMAFFDDYDAKSRNSFIAPPPTPLTQQQHDNNHVINDNDSVISDMTSVFGGLALDNRDSSKSHRSHINNGSLTSESHKKPPSPFNRYSTGTMPANNLSNSHQNTPTNNSQSHTNLLQDHHPISINSAASMLSIGDEKNISKHSMFAKSSVSHMSDKSSHHSHYSIVSNNLSARSSIVSQDILPERKLSIGTTTAVPTSLTSTSIEKLFEEVNNGMDFHPPPLVVENENDDEDDDDDEEDEDESDQPQYDDLNTLMNHYPLKTLGNEAREILNRQQLNIIRSMWMQLRNGVAIIKHGRHGKPKEKVLFCDVAMTKLFWKNPGSGPGNEEVDNDDDLETIEHKSKDTRRRSSIFGAAGSTITSTFRRHSDQNRVVLFREIIAVSDDCSSEVIQRSINKGYYLSDGNMLITVTDSHRTLDFEIESKLWPDVFHALQVLMHFYQGHLTASIQSHISAQESPTVTEHNVSSKGHFFPIFR